jgi:hypothetical protein
VYIYIYSATSNSQERLILLYFTRIDVKPDEYYHIRSTGSVGE